MPWHPFNSLFFIYVHILGCLQSILWWKFHYWWWYFVAPPVSHKETQHIQDCIEGDERVGRFFFHSLPEHMWWQLQCTTLAWRTRRANQPSICTWDKFLSSTLGTFVDNYIMPSLTFSLDEAKENYDSHQRSGVQDYAVSFLSDLMIVEQFKDIVHEGDGNCMLSMWKFLLL